jgi:RNA polymerase sigma factor (sigma-70 family)
MAEDNNLIELILSYKPLVRAKAGDFLRRTGGAFGITSYDDLCQAGIFGIIRAYRTFDPDIGTPFSAFVSLHIMYAVYSEGKKGNEVDKSAINESVEMSDARRTLEFIYERAVTDAELAYFIGLDEDEISRRIADIQNRLSQSVPLDDSIPSTFGRTDDLAYREELKNFLEKGMEYLTPIEKRVLNEIYWRGLTLETIGLSLGVSRQRVHSIRNEAVAKIRRYMKQEKVVWHGLDDID